MCGTRKLLAALALLAVGAAQAADDAVFVNAAAGGDVQDGLSPKTAVRAITTGIQRAAGSGRSRVLVAAGTYGAFRMANGVDVAGGYTPDFSRMDSAATEVMGAFMPELGQSAVVLADGITQPTRLTGMTLRQADAPVAGHNTVGIVIRNGSSGLTVENVKIIGAAAGGGLAGAAGSDASPSPAPAGAAGTAAAQFGFCNDSARRPGGAGGQNNPLGPTAAGGAGGAGGTQSSDCRGVFPDLDPTAGLPGTSAGSAQGGAGGPPNSTSPAPNGANGYAPFAADGAHGARGNGQLGLVNGAPTRATGGAGSAGQHGVGGAGGGGGGGISVFGGVSNAGAGAGGGGGGSGGARAPLGGQPGLAGGNSIGILVLNSSPAIRNCAIARGTGGTGGAGGAGGRGQPGGAGGAGGAGLPGMTGTSTRGAGGAGGAGSRGGHSGSGAGGPGGHSIGILRHASSAPAVQSVTYSDGAGGSGGPAGQAYAGSGQAGLPGQVHGLLSF